MKINIDPINYDVVYSEKPNYGDDIEVFGFIDSDNCKIHIKKDLHPTRSKIVLLHELLHAMLMKCGLNLKEEEDDLHEQLIECLSHSLISLIKNNPDLIAYLSNSDGE